MKRGFDFKRLNPKRFSDSRLVYAGRILLFNSLVVATVLCITAVSVSPQKCPPEQYMDEHEPRRRALVIGNAKYTQHEELPSAEKDAREITDRLIDLNFIVDLANDRATKTDFSKAVANFMATIEQGDLVVFYYSGHGFSYGADGFLAPTELPKSVVENRLPDSAMAIDSVRSMLESKQPGMLIMIMDACRTIGDFVISPKDQNSAAANTSSSNSPLPEASPSPAINLAAPGLKEPRGGSSIHYLVAFSAHPGKVAIGTSAAGQMSTYTRWLVAYLTNEGKSVKSVFSQAGTEVIEKTNKTQIPVLISPWVTDPFLRPTTFNRDEDRKAWLVALDTPITPSIEGYTLRHSVTRHTAAARRWLKDPECAAGGFTLISPVAVERAWRLNNFSRVAVRRLETHAFAFPRSMEVGWQRDVVTAADKEVGIVPTGTTKQELATERVGEQYLANTWGIESTSNEARRLAFTIASMDVHENIVATQNLVARAQPDDKAELISRIPTGTQLKVRGLAEGQNDSVWIEVLNDINTSPFFIRVDPSFAASRPIVELGQSLNELVIKPRPQGLPDLIDPEPLRDAVAELKNQGWEITWISLATGAVNDKTEQAIRDARLAHARYLLKQIGIPGLRMTAVTAVNDFKEDGVRIRFFGVPK